MGVLMLEETDVLIVGAGPIGIELGAELRRRGRSCVLVEAGAIGQTLTWWAPGTQFFSSPERIELAGVPMVTREQQKATREEYLAYLRQVVGAFRLEVRTFERVERIEGSEGAFEVVSRGVRTGEERRHRCGKVVLATGNMDQPRLVGVPGEGLGHVSHYLRDPHEYWDREVLIVGGKNSAVEAAIRLYRAGARVTVSYRRERFDRDRIKYWLLPEIEWLIEKGKMGFEACTEVRAIEPGRTVLERVEPAGEPGVFRGTGEMIEKRPDEVLLLTGYVQDPALFESLGIELVGPERRPCHARETMETDVAGVFVAGTAVGGTQRRTRVFIETSHIHVERIVAKLCGEEPPGEGEGFGSLEES